MTAHIFHKCNRCECMICAGGLQFCEICRQGEAELEDTCPGAPPEFNPWQQTMDLKIERGCLYQKWYRERPDHTGNVVLRQTQWRPVKGQGQQPILPDKIEKGELSK